VHRRTEAGFERSVCKGLENFIPLSEIKSVLPLSDVYQDVKG